MRRAHGRHGVAARGWVWCGGAGLGLVRFSKARQVRHGTAGRAW